MLALLALLSGCKHTVCPAGSSLGDDGLCYLDEDTGLSCDGLTYASVGQPYLLTYCTGCHSSGVTGEWRRGAPEGTDLQTLDGVHRLADRIAARIEDGTMPPGGGARAEQTARMLAWLDCGAPGEDNPLPPGGSSLIGDAMEVAVSAEEDDGALVVTRQIEIGTRSFGDTWSTERYTVDGAQAWWHGYTLHDADGDILREVTFFPEIELTVPAEGAVEATVEEDGMVFTEDWSVSVERAEDAEPIDGRQVSWEVTEVRVFVGAEEHGWHLSESRGMVARWSVLDADRSFTALQIGETFTDGSGFPVSTEIRWLERIVVPGGWSL